MGLAASEYTTRHAELGTTTWYGEDERIVGHAAGASRAAWSYENAWTEVERICGMVSFEPDKIEVHLDGARLRLEPGQTVIPHGIDRDLTAAEAGPGRQP